MAGHLSRNAVLLDLPCTVHSPAEESTKGGKQVQETRCSPAVVARSQAPWLQKLELSQAVRLVGGVLRVAAEVVVGGWGGADIATATRCNIRRSQDSCCIIASSSFLSLSSWICFSVRLDLRD